MISKLDVQLNVQRKEMINGPYPDCKLKRKKKIRQDLSYLVYFWHFQKEAHLMHFLLKAYFNF